MLSSAWEINENGISKLASSKFILSWGILGGQLILTVIWQIDSGMWKKHPFISASVVSLLKWPFTELVLSSETERTENLAESVGILVKKSETVQFQATGQLWEFGTFSRRENKSISAFYTKERKIHFTIDEMFWKKNVFVRKNSKFSTHTTRFKGIMRRGVTVWSC